MLYVLFLTAFWYLLIICIVAAVVWGLCLVARWLAVRLTAVRLCPVAIKTDHACAAQPLFLLPALMMLPATDRHNARKFINHWVRILPMRTWQRSRRQALDDKHLALIQANNQLKQELAAVCLERDLLVSAANWNSLHARQARHALQVEQRDDEAQMVFEAVNGIV